MKCQSLLAKRAVLSTFVHEHNPDILANSETWLSPSITDTELLLPNYNIFQKDRSDGYGGVLLAYSKSLITQQLHYDTQAEAITCQVALKNNCPPLIICSIYRPPTNNLQSVEQLCSLFNAIKTTYQD